MTKISTGEDSTLATYRRIAAVLRGEESRAVAFINAINLMARRRCATIFGRDMMPCPKCGGYNIGYSTHQA